MQVSLECFTVTVREKRKTAILDLTNFDGKGASVKDIIQARIELLKTSRRSYGNKVGYLISSNVKNSTYHGVIKVGEHGLASDVMNIKTGKTDYKKGRDHADLSPLYFSVSIAAGGDRGIMVLEKISSVGIKGFLINYILEEFEQKHPGFLLEFKTIAPSFVFQNYLRNGKVKSITFVKHKIPADLADVVAQKKDEQEGSVEITIKPKFPDIFRPKDLVNHLNAKNEAATFYSYNQFEPDETKIKVNIAGGDHVISLNNWAKLRAAFDITAKVPEDLTGYPDIAEVEKEADSLIKTIAHASGIKL